MLVDFTALTTKGARGRKCTICPPSTPQMLIAFFSDTCDTRYSHSVLTLWYNESTKAFLSCSLNQAIYLFTLVAVISYLFSTSCHQKSKEARDRDTNAPRLLHLFMSTSCYYDMIQKNKYSHWRPDYKSVQYITVATRGSVCDKFPSEHAYSLSMRIL